MRRIAWRRAERALDHCGNLIIIDCPRPARAGLVQKTLDPIPQEPTSPFAHCMLMHTQLRSDRFARDTIRAAQNDPAALIGSVPHDADAPAAQDRPVRQNSAPTAP
jgi:hypothetical protein